MAGAVKLLEQMRSNPRDWRIGQLKTVARHFGLTIRQSGGSQVIFQKTGWLIELSVPARRPIKPFYIKKFIELVEAS